MRIHTLLLLLPIALFPADALQKPGAKPPEKAPEKPADPSTTPASAPLVVPPQFLAPIETIVKQLAKGGREKEMKDLLAVLDKLGYPKANFDKLDKTSHEDLAKAKIVLDSLPSGAKQLRITAKQLVAIMDKTEDVDQKTELAHQIVKLDGDNEQAHKFLGDEKVGKSWVHSEFKDMRVRRGEILQKVEEAKKMPVDIETGEVDDELIQKACGVKATMVRRGYFEMHTNFALEKSERILREASRAYALSMWLRGKSTELKLPPSPAPGSKTARTVWTVIDSREQYKKLGADLLAAGELTAEDTKLMSNPDTQVNGYSTKSGAHVFLGQVETATEAPLLVALCGMQEGTHTALTAGHLNWLTLTCFGCEMPNYVIKQEERRSSRGDTHVQGENEKREREELLRLAKSGIAGSRTWMEYLVEHGEDPPWRESFVESLGMIQGNDLHKCTSIVDFLQEADRFSGIFRKLGNSTTASMVELYNAALGESVGELEAQWRTWLLGNKPGVAERIDKENLNAYPPDALAVLELMNKIREDTFKGKVEGLWKLKFDPDLSENCGLHAHYLAQHPEQQKWPDAHEEYADKDGYTVEGAWAGAHSVILFGGSGDYRDRVYGWMGTFYHRLPLIDPGVLRLGWGSEDLNAVMDMSSLAAPYDKPYVVIYPYDRQTDVPPKFDGNEFPDPVPDMELTKANGARDQVDEGAVFGYPVTIQTNPIDERGDLIDIDMKLYEGKDMKTQVDCYLSTPSKPTNPELAPRGAWCLIPKAFLKDKTEYKVIANWSTGGMGGATNVGKHMEWTFRTK